MCPMSGDERTVKHLQQQVIELQEQLAYQDDILHKLNDVIALQDEELRQLKEWMQILNRQFKELKDDDHSAGRLHDSEKPPHY